MDFLHLLDRIFRWSPYESDYTRFMKDFMAKHPEEAESQRAGRAAWWDKTPGERSPVPPMHHSPRAGGNEATFTAPEGEER